MNKLNQYLQLTSQSDLEISKKLAKILDNYEKHHNSMTLEDYYEYSLNNLTSRKSNILNNLLVGVILGCTIAISIVNYGMEDRVRSVLPSFNLTGSK